MIYESNHNGIRFKSFPISKLQDKNPAIHQIDIESL